MVTTVIVRMILFSLLPVMLAWLVIQIDKSANSDRRRLEVFLILLFAIAVAGNGIVGFFGHLFLADVVAESIGWESGSPFQQEMAFANLAIGVLGMVAVGRRDGFREATVIAVTVLGLGATIVHLIDIVQAGNLAAGNTLQNFANLVRPALLIWSMRASRRAEASLPMKPDPISLEQWRNPLVRVTGPVTITIATAYGLGFALGHLWIASLAGAIIAFVILALSLARSPIHDVAWGRRAQRAG